MKMGIVSERQSLASAGADELRSALVDNAALARLLRWAQVDVAPQTGGPRSGVMRGRSGPAFGGKR